MKCQKELLEVGEENNLEIKNAIKIYQLGKDNLE